MMSAYNSTTTGQLWSGGDVVVPGPDDVMADPWLRVLFISLYCIIFILGISGNSLVVYVVVRNPIMQTITNVFIANLAISDIMMCLLAVPFTPLSGLLKSWVFGETLCHIVPMTLGLSVHVSTLTSTAIAVDRYFVIVHPFRARMKVAACLMLIASIWVISVSISMPLAVYQKVTWMDDEQIYVCHEFWPKPTARQFFTVISLILQYIVPCAIITFCYSKVSIALRTRSRAKLAARGSTSAGSGSGGRGGGVGGGISSHNFDRHRMEIRRKRRTNRMLIAMVSIFVCCWLPLNVIHLTLEYHERLEHWKYFLLVFFIAHVIAVSSTIYNPFLYAWMNDNFRKEFRRVLPCLSSIAGDRRLFVTDAASKSQYSVVGNNTPGGTATAFPLTERRGTDVPLSSIGDRLQGPSMKAFTPAVGRGGQAYYITETEAVALNCNLKCNLGNGDFDETRVG